MYCFWPCVAMIIAAAIKKGCSYRNNRYHWLHGSDLEHSLMKEKKNRSSYVFFPISMFCQSRFRFRNLCFWHDMTLNSGTQLGRWGEEGGGGVGGWFSEKCPDCVHFWVKFSTQNAVLRVSRRKNSQIFSCGIFFSGAFNKMFIKVL